MLNLFYILVSMKRTSILSFLLLVPFLSFGQVNSSFDIIAGMDRSHRINLELDNPSSPFGPEDTSYGARSSYEKSLTAWRLGVNYNRVLFDDVKIRVGLRVMNAGFTSGQINDFETQALQNGDDGWIIEPPLTDQFEKFYKFFYIELPVALRYNFDFVKSVEPYVEFGMGPAFLIGSQTKEVTNINIVRSKLDDLKVIQYVGFISPGLNFKVRELNSWFVQAIFRCHATPIQNGGEYEDYLYSLGVEVGFRKHLDQ